MGQIKSIIMLALEPDFSKVESGEVEPYRVCVPDLKFAELKAFFDDEVQAGFKVDLRIADDYLDWASLEVSKTTNVGIHGLLDYCAKSVMASPPKKGQSGVIDVSKAWAAGPLLPDRSMCAPPKVVFLAASAASIINMGIWIHTLQSACGDFEKKKGMSSSIRQELERFFGLPFLPCAMVSHQSAVTPAQLKSAMSRTILR